MHDRDRVMQSGALSEGVVLLEKPFSRDNLLRRVRRLLDGPAAGS